MLYFLLALLEMIILVYIVYQLQILNEITLISVIAYQLKSARILRPYYVPDSAGTNMIKTQFLISRSSQSKSRDGHIKKKEYK